VLHFKGVAVSTESTFPSTCWIFYGLETLQHKDCFALVSDNLS
jgi:hypothetical protein